MSSSTPEDVYKRQTPSPYVYAANGSNPRFDFTAEVPAASSLGSVHFIAIGGAGMSGVARVMLARGLAVSGSDAKESLVLAALVTEGAQVHIGHDAANLGDADTVVISSAIRENNVELQEARSRGLRVMHRSQALASVMQGRRRVAVAGANGKTTTTSMLVVALQQCGVDPSFAVGGELAKHGTNAHHGTGEIFVAEADESDGSFLVYRPEVAIVTNVQPDHLDFYGTFVAIQAAYAKFAATVQPDGLLVTCADDQGSRDLCEVARAAGTRVVTYGLALDADVRLTDVGGAGMHAHAQLMAGGVGEAGRAVLGRLDLGIPGRHNLLNATRVEQVVPTRYAEIEATEHCSAGFAHPACHELRMRVHPGTAHVGEPHVRISSQAIGDHPGACAPGHFTQVARSLVVRTGHQQTVRLHGSGELGVCLLYTSDAAVEVEVVRLHVGHDGNLGPIDEEGPVALIGFGHEDLASAVVGVGAVLGELAADGERRIDSTLLQGDHQHRRGRG